MIEGVDVTVVRLPYRQPLHIESLLEFLGARAVPGIDRLDDDGYHRTMRLPHGTGTVTLRPGPRHVKATLRLADDRDREPAIARCRLLFDLDADAAAVDAVLGADPALAPLVAKEPGVRTPRAVDGFEIAVRAVVGQQISVAAARKVLARLVPTGNLFPTPAELLELPDEAFAMPGARRQTLRTLARAVAVGDLVLDGTARDATIAGLKALPGIGDWTAQYVAMRALGDPDAFLPTDLGVRRGATSVGLPADPKALSAHAERWRPWRSYAVIRLWRVA
jgi:AraC family transcriptional regulator of adaptative response / DNA-3-methyladenine glycosylase II